MFSRLFAKHSPFKSTVYFHRSFASEPQKTCLHDLHVKNGGKMVCNLILFSFVFFIVFISYQF